MKRTRIKVCGMTRAEDVVAASELGVDAIGMILHADSPRLISLSRARELRREIPPFVTLIGVFVDADLSLVEQYCSELELDMVQLHGSETADYAASLTRPYIKAIRVQSREQVVQAQNEYATSRGLLLDPYVPGKHGGTGELLQQSHWPSDGVACPMILAGGLNPDNISQRIQTLKPYAVDINSGVESEPGEKSAAMLGAAIEQVRQADAV